MSDTSEQIVELKREGFEPIKIQLMLRPNGEVFVFKGDKGEREGIWVGTANQAKRRPEFYTPGMRFKRTGYEDDEYVLVSGSLFDMYKTNYAMLANIATGNNWWSAAKVANHARITREEFAKIVNYYTAEFELIEKEPKI